MAELPPGDGLLWLQAKKAMVLAVNAAKNLA